MAAKDITGDGKFTKKDLLRMRGVPGFKKGGATKKKAPKGMHYMPDGKLMKDSEHKKAKGMKHGGMAKCKRDGIAMRGRTRAGK